ncbi:MAG: aspartate--tRNA ligase [Clostridiales bacterium GWE2_32_10]|nr:MAG: aspartate--tRNA ligase [Clostridiales bacterium GWE2_32_10]HBY20159.1 aspartate--tRNA ligase [Clostridiales bacterium]
MSENMKGIHRTHRCTDVTESLIEEKVVVAGWVQTRRDLGGLIFIDLRDISGVLQVVFDAGYIHKEGFVKAEKLRGEYVIIVEGVVAKRREETINSKVPTGTIELFATDFRILSESQTPPFHIDENVSVNEELRLKYRYLDLRRPDIQKNFILRHKAYQSIREYYSKERFLEIETPVLTKSTPEGARDYLVPSRVHPGMFYALPQSPQLFKQLLMVSGFDRYMQITKCYRDEDLRSDRQPEFTQIDTEMSFVDVDDVIQINEKMLQKVFKECVGVDIELPIKRMTYEHAMNKYGSDKPDLRYGLELVDLSNIVRDCGFKVFADAVANGGSVRAINVQGQADMPRRQIDSLTEFVKIFKAKGMAWIAIEADGSHKSAITKFLTDEETGNILKAMDAEHGDLILFCADKDKVVFDALGGLRQELAKKLGLINKDEYNFIWITEFPLLEYSEEDKRYVAIHHPFTAPMDEDIKLLDKDPEKVRAKAYDIVLNGYEIGGGSVRIHQREIQEKMFALLGFTQQEAYDRFGFLLNAFKYGVPPHAGIAYGLDRIIMIMAGCDNIRDVIAFPKTKDASCLMTEAPNVVEEKQLKELGIRVEK